LNRNYYFTERRPHSPPAYEYHALFREFLLSRATETLAPQSLSTLRHNAATLLEEAGEIEEALMLFQEVGDWDMMIRSILTHAPSMLEQGRNLILEKWLASLPKEMFDTTPWLLYWMGACKMPFAPAVSRQHFERAYEQFKVQEDVAGIFLAWSGVVEAILHSWEDWPLVDEWIMALREVMRKYDTFPSDEVEAFVTSGMCGTILATPHHADIEVWLERAMRLSENERTITAKGMALHLAAQYYLMRGDLEKVVSALGSLELLTRSVYVKPLVKIALLLSEGIYLWHVGSYDRCFKSLSKALELSQSTGVHIYDHALLGNMACAALEAGDKTMAAEYLEKMASSLDQLMKYDKNFYYYLKAKQAFYQGNLRQAAAHVETSSKLTAEFGFPFGLALTHLMKSQVLHELGRREAAEDCLVQARNIGREIRSDIIMLHVYLIEAQRAMNQGNEATALAALQNALTIGRETGYVFAQEPHVTATLLAKALEAEIEVEYAQDVIKKRNIVPDKPPLHLENWPWPLKAFTLGRFALVKDEKPIRFFKKAQQKPLSLLKALIAFGGRAVKEERIADALWPEADGDMAHQSLATTLYRLRTLIGYHEAVQLGDGRLTLDPRYCWVDVWAFERMLGQADVIWDKEPKERAAAQAVELTQEAINLYQGPFLSGETGDYWIISFREKLRSKFLRSVESLGNYHEGAEQWEYAGACYQRALEVDDLAEGCYRRLMVCHQKLGRRAEALAVYDRCKEALAMGLGVEPSPETQAVCRALISE
jgi:DNA-binding SARP family transcriptional activator